MKDRVRVLQIITGLRPGGAERVLLQLFEALDGSRFETRIASLSRETDALDAYGFKDTQVDIYDMTHRRLQNLLKLARDVDEFQPQVIHAHMFHALVAAVGAKAIARTKPAICFTGHRTVHALWRRTALTVLKRQRKADVLFTPSVRSRVDARQAVIIPNGVSVGGKLFTRSCWGDNRPLRVLAVGRLIEDKDPLGLVRSFAAANLHQATLTFLGDGPLRAEIARLAEALGVGNRVILSGFSGEVREQMRVADVFVMHSHQEGMPMALLEAGAEAMPAIATPVGSIPTVLGMDRGVLASPRTFPDALRRIAVDPKGALEMGERLRTHVELNYSIDVTARSHEQLYSELAGATDRGA
ncbi:glycosyltransferase [Mesorhizobium sp.]|uniref:glycosyltransferase n=1 Tax=Mesorhizobium sp. TaxID=1871066 RepID=UPI00257A3D6B|nr:glycosyltransferase [Mesorhizobium sp.]